MNHRLPPLVDGFGRIHSGLRISVTDRCNIRCFYCMPNENVVFKPRSELLTYDEMTRFVEALIPAGLNKLRITGGEPLVRSNLDSLISRLANLDGIDDLALTTNGILLDEQAQDLRNAGLMRINISLDSLNEEVFEKIARRKGLDRVLKGIDKACEVGFDRIRLNAIAMKNLTEDEILPLAEFARRRGLELRFIEFMPLDAEGNWKSESVLSGREILDRLKEAFGDLIPVDRSDRHQPATDFEFADGLGRIGFINSVTEPFCGDCNRLRITAEGQVRNCLFSTTEWDAKEILRSGGSDDQLVQLVRDCVEAKKHGHGIDTGTFVKPERAMFQIGG